MEEKTKKFKDPLYGYIEIDNELVQSVIDTGTFQRLRDIRQTSYAPLYPSALHNRFVHSLGVYHLGKIASSALRKSANEEKTENIKNIIGNISGEQWDRYEKIFSLACLLHDVGHSPFSHTGEEFFKNSKSKIGVESLQKMADEIIDKVTKEKIQEELNKNGYNIYIHLSLLTQDIVFVDPSGHNPSEHEIMSAIVALESFNNQFNDNDEKSFFARCITGILYEQATWEKFENMSSEEYIKHCEEMLKNCFIHMLNSRVIDVDRLDYLIRDAKMMGYQSLSIDYNRLLSGIVLVQDNKKNITFGFHKNAISVIENVVYAHDIEKKWVQNHPIILYESFLLQRSIEMIEGKVKQLDQESKSTLFSYDSLTAEGSHFDSIHIHWFSDSDLIHMMKNNCDCSYAEEYFVRNIRCHPVWKSEAEYRYFFDENERELINDMMEMAKGDSKRDAIEINANSLEEIKKDIEDANKNGMYTETKKRKQKLFEDSLNLCGEYGIQQKLVMLSTAFFVSNFSKNDIKKLYILFSGSAQPCKISDVSTILSSEINDNKTMWYLFYYPPKEQTINAKEFAKKFINIIRKNE